MPECSEWYYNRVPTDPCAPPGMGCRPLTAPLTSIAVGPRRLSPSPGPNNPATATAQLEQTGTPLLPSTATRGVGSALPAAEDLPPGLQ